MRGKIGQGNIIGLTWDRCSLLSSLSSGENTDLAFCIKCFNSREIKGLRRWHVSIFIPHKVIWAIRMTIGSAIRAWLPPKLVTVALTPAGRSTHVAWLWWRGRRETEREKWGGGWRMHVERVPGWCVRLWQGGGAGQGGGWRAGWRGGVVGCPQRWSLSAQPPACPPPGK